MDKKRLDPALLFGALGMGLLILDPKTAVSGAREGLDLCISTVIPSLFPFFLMSGLLTGALLGKKVRSLRPLGQALGLPEGAESIFLVGLLGGYPVGAQAVAEACRSVTLEKKTARRMLGFCSNAGPSFLFGMVAAQFPYPWVGWVLWAVHILSAIIAGLILPHKKCAAATIRQTVPPGFSQAMYRGLKAMANVCGWVILFRVIIAAACRWFLWLLPETAQIFVSGILELSNGCCMLRQIGNVGQRMIFASVFLGFGGLCVMMQTSSVISAAGLDLRFYFPGKLIQAVLSFLLTWAVQLLLPEEQRFLNMVPVEVIFAAACLIIIIFLLKSKKEVAFPREFMYNQSKSY